MRSLKDQSAQTTARVLGVAYHLWLPFSINKVSNLTNFRRIIFSFLKCCYSFSSFYGTRMFLRVYSFT